MALELAEAPAVLPAGDPSVINGRIRRDRHRRRRGVTAEALFPIVRELKPKLILLGRTPADAKEPEWVPAGLADEQEIKSALLARPDRPPTPKGVAEECKRVLAGREVNRNLARLREAGATVEYINVDVQNGPVLSAA